MSYLPIDVIRIILLNLPAKSLIRFKTVCKSWYEIIDNPKFVELHVEKSNLQIVFRNPTLHMCDFDTFDNAVELDYPFKYLDDDYVEGSFHRGVYTIGSCRGLLCFLTDSWPYTLFLYNPTTRSHKTLPSLAVESPFHANSFNYLGFGYDRVSEDYKCVRILQDFPSLNEPDYMSYATVSESQVMVYSLRADSWRRGAQDVPYFFCCHYEDSIDIRGILHWCVEDEHRTVLPIVSFNLNDEIFSSVSLPDYDTETYSYAQIGVIDDCLCLILNYQGHCDAWIMKEYSVPASWTRLLRFTKQFICKDMRLISFIDSRKQLLVCYYNYNVASVDLETSKITNVDLPGFRRIWSAYVCLEYLLMFKDAEDGLGDTTNTKNDAKRRRLMRKAERS